MFRNILPSSARTEAVDISYTKDWADFNHPNKVDPAVNQLYIGWESDSEWTNYTVYVNKPGKYRIITVYGYQDNHSELWLNGKKAITLVVAREYRKLALLDPGNCW